jgi:hypothetical protein
MIVTGLGEKVDPVPQNAQRVSAGLNPRRVRSAGKRGSCGVNLLGSPEGRSPKATAVSLWHGVDSLEIFVQGGL